MAKIVRVLQGVLQLAMLPEYKEDKSKEREGGPSRTAIYIAVGFTGVDHSLVSSS